MYIYLNMILFHFINCVRVQHFCHSVTTFSGNYPEKQIQHAERNPQALQETIIRQSVHSTGIVACVCLPPRLALAQDVSTKT